MPGSRGVPREACGRRAGRGRAAAGCRRRRRARSSGRPARADAPGGWSSRGCSWRRCATSRSACSAWPAGPTSSGPPRCPAASARPSPSSASSSVEQKGGDHHTATLTKALPPHPRACTGPAEQGQLLIRPGEDYHGRRDLLWLRVTEERRLRLSPPRSKTREGLFVYSRLLRHAPTDRLLRR